MNDKIILWEAHRGGAEKNVLPESCAISFEYGWLHGGRPEADVNLTKDGVMVSLHDSVLDRVARSLPEKFRGVPVSEMNWEDVRSADIGNEEYPDQHVLTIEYLFARLRENPERGMVIDYKRVPLELLADLIRKYDTGRQITFASCNTDILRKMKSLVPEIRTKHWIGGNAESIMRQFLRDEAENFASITEVQLHLNDADSLREDGWRYQISPEFVRQALEITEKRGVLLQTLPWEFEKADLFRILDLGVRSFAVDYPEKFVRFRAEYFARKCE